MNNAVSVEASAPGGVPILPSSLPRRVLRELLALNKEMIEQLYVERSSDLENAEFLTEMIGQHLQSVNRLQAELDGRQPG